MIKSFRARALNALWQANDRSGVRPDLADRVVQRLVIFDKATKPGDMNVPGFDFHRLKGRAVRFSVHVNGPWCVTFEWDGTDAVRVDLEQYH